MRKVVIIGLISIHLFGNTELNQLFKIPELITHFVEHHRQNTHISFLDFIAMHYGGDDGTDADNQEDQKLPFHSCNIHGNSTAYSAILKIVPTSQGVDDNDIKFFNLFIPANSPSGFFDLVKQPPRFS